MGLKSKVDLTLRPNSFAKQIIQYGLTTIHLSPTPPALPRPPFFWQYQYHDILIVIYQDPLLQLIIAPEEETRQRSAITPKHFCISLES